MLVAAGGRGATCVLWVRAEKAAEHRPRHRHPAPHRPPQQRLVPAQHGNSAAAGKPAPSYGQIPVGAMGISQEREVDRGQGDVGNGIGKGRKPSSAIWQCGNSGTSVRFLVRKPGWLGRLHPEKGSPPRTRPIQRFALSLVFLNIFTILSHVRHLPCPRGYILDGMMPILQGGNGRQHILTYKMAAIT